MTFIPDSYVRAKDAVDKITQQVSSYITVGESAIETISQVRDSLARMESRHNAGGWLEAVQFINQTADNNPNDEQWQQLKAEVNKIVADFRAAKDRYETLRDTINAL